MKALSIYSLAITVAMIGSSIARAEDGPEGARTIQSTTPSTTVNQTATSTIDPKALALRVAAVRKKVKDHPSTAIVAEKGLVEFVKQNTDPVTGGVPYNDPKFQQEILRRLSIINKTLVKTSPADGIDRDDVAREQQALAEERARSEAALQKCTADCEAARSADQREIDRLRAENDAIKRQAEADARSRQSSYDRDHDRDHDRDRDDLDRDGRTSRNGRNSGRTPREVLGNLFGNPAMNGGPFGNDPFGLGNPNLFGANGMQNPYNNWLQQQQLAQMMMGNQNMNNPYGLNQGRQLPSMYPAPGGGIGQQPWPGNPYNRGPMGGGAPMFAGTPYAGAPFSGGYGMGGAPMIAGGAFPGAGYGGGYRPVQYGAGGGGGYALGGGIGGGYANGYRGNAPAVLPIAGGGVGGAYGGGYGLGANVGGWSTPIYNGGGYNQYAQRSLPNIYPAPY